jgi:hypothetical protein
LLATREWRTKESTPTAVTSLTSLFEVEHSEQQLQQAVAAWLASSWRHFVCFQAISLIDAVPFQEFKQQLFNCAHVALLNSVVDVGAVDLLN